MTLQESIKQYRLQLLAIIPLLVLLYFKILPDMVKDWLRDDNYSHGFLVPLIAGYFLWQRWPDLRTKRVKTDIFGLTVIVLGMCQLIVAWLGTEYFTMRSSLIVLLAGMVVYLFGREVLKGMALPLCYLLFMVPIPYIIYDFVAFPLKLFVTRVSVAALKIVGVVVMREGNIIMFPATTLEVADACSGIRSLVSLLALSVAYAFFIRTSGFRRAIIIVSAVPIAIATNALRVIGTGILAQWWGEKAAQGFFHEFAGLAVFALAMLLLVAVGTVVKGKQLSPATAESADFCAIEQNGQLSPVVDRIYRRRFITLFILLGATAFYLHFHQTTMVPTNKAFSQFPSQIQSWTMVSEALFSDAVLGVLKPTDYISRQYRGTDGNKVTLYVGYHNGAKGTGGIHSPKHCLPGSGWYEVSSGLYPLTLNGKQEQIVRAVYQKGESKELFLYWFQMKGKVLNNEYALKWGEITNSILYSRREETFIRISIPFSDDEAAAMARGEQFIKDFYPVISEFLPQ